MGVLARSGAASALLRARFGEKAKFLKKSQKKGLTFEGGGGNITKLSRMTAGRRIGGPAGRQEKEFEKFLDKAGWLW